MSIKKIISVQLIGNLLKTKNYQNLYTLMETASILDITYILYSLSRANLELFVNVFPFLINYDNMVHLEQSRRDLIFSLIDNANVEKLANNMNEDEILEILYLVNIKNRKRLLNLVSTKIVGAYRIKNQYTYGQIGFNMSMCYVIIPAFWSIDKATKYITKEISKNDIRDKGFTQIYIVDHKVQPLGYVTLSELFSASGKNVAVEKIMHTDFKIVTASEKINKVAQEFNLYKRLFLIVVDDFGKMLGVVDTEDVIDVISKKVQENVLDIGGVGEMRTSLGLNFLYICFDRFKWLFIALFSSVLSAFVVSNFTTVIEERIILAVMMPVIASLGGNVGIQTLSVILRSFNNGIPCWSLVLKEVTINMLNGIILGALASIFVGVFLGSFKLGLVVAFAMFFNMIWSSFVGAAMPIIITKLGFDETVSSGPVITSINDIFGFAIFLGLATIFL